MTTKYTIIGEGPATESPDAIQPWGAKNDNTHCPAFVRACTKRYSDLCTYLDLGCAGGGLVCDFLEAGCEAVGLEGSTWPRDNNVKEWNFHYRTHLFNVDLAKSFQVKLDGHFAWFDAIGAWDVLEHIHERDLPLLCENIRRHLSPSGIFVASIATHEDPPYHQTVKPQAWWEGFLLGAGFKLANVFDPSVFPRGTGNGPMDWDFRTNPRGFHIQLTRHGA